MPRKSPLDRPARLEVTLPQSLLTAVSLELWSEIEAKVPYGKFSEVVRNCLREWLAGRGLQSPGRGWRILPLTIIGADIWLCFNHITDESQVFTSHKDAGDFIALRKES